FFFGTKLRSRDANFDGHFPYGFPYGEAPRDDYYMGTKSVGWYKANAFGLYDMHGNAAEWCHDWYDKDYYLRKVKNDPQGPEAGKYRIMRGGFWPHVGGRCRSAWRWWYLPEESNNTLGFRVVCEVKTSPK